MTLLYYTPPGGVNTYKIIGKMLLLINNKLTQKYGHQRPDEKHQEYDQRPD